MHIAQLAVDISITVHAPLQMTRTTNTSYLKQNNNKYSYTDITSAHLFQTDWTELQITTTYYYNFESILHRSLFLNSNNSPIVWDPLASVIATIVLVSLRRSRFAVNLVSPASDLRGFYVYEWTKFSASRYQGGGERPYKFLIFANKQKRTSFKIHGTSLL